jgi:hypothetical protein
MNRHKHGAPGSHSKRKQDDDKRSDFHGPPQAVNHEHERGAGRLIISRRRFVGRQSQPEQPLSTNVRQKSPVSDFLGAFGCRSSRISAGCCMPATTRSCTWKSNARNGGKKTVPSGGQSGALASGLHSKQTCVASPGANRRRCTGRSSDIETAAVAGPCANGIHSQLIQIHWKMNRSCSPRYKSQTSNQRGRVRGLVVHGR